MNAIQRLLRRSRKSDADNQFKRFLKLNYRRYAKLCITGSDADPSDSDDNIAKACREWLPSLSKQTHRDICASIAKFHESSAMRAASLDSLMTALDNLLEVSPNEHLEFVRASTPPPQTRSQMIRQTSQDLGKPVYEAGAGRDPSMICSYCRSAPGKPALFLFGPHVAVCDSSECLTKHDRMLRAEFTELRNPGPASRNLH